MSNEQVRLWFSGAFFLGKVISVGRDKFYKNGNVYIWEHEIGAVVVKDSNWLYPAFFEACNSYGIKPEDVFFGEFLGIPHALEN